MPGPYLRTRVARRLYALFLGISMVPMLLLGAYAYFQVTSQLVDASLERVREDTKSVGMEMLGHLNALSEELRQAALLDSLGHPVSGETESRFASFVAGPLASLDLSPRQHEHISRGSVALLPRPDEVFDLVMLAPDGAALFWGALKPGALWPETVRGITYCIHDLRGARLHCSPESESIPDPFPIAPDGHSGTATIKVRGAPYLVAHWQVPLEPMFAHEAVTVVGFYPRHAALAAVAHFQRVFPALLALTLVLAIWLAMRQIRRQLRPLDALVEASTRVGDGDFDARVSRIQTDEFGDLANAFNAMASSLQRKFSLLELLATLDRAILLNTEIKVLVPTILNQLPSATSCENVGILLPHPPGNGKTAHLHFRLASHGSAIRSSVVSLGDEAIALLTNGAPCIECPREALDSDFARPFADAGLHSLWLFPASSKQEPGATLVLAYAAQPPEIADTLQGVRSVVDRLAAAKTNLALEEALYRKLHYDALTGLPNLVLLRDRVEQAIGNAERDRRSVALMLLDLDRFRDINDSLGHATGDAVLIAVANRLTSSVRQVDTVTRFGGDEFAILLTELDRGHEVAVASGVAQLLIDAISDPFEVDGQPISIGGSIGVSLYPANSGRFEDLLKGAEAAMYEAKRLQPGSYRFHSPAIDKRARERFERIQQLQRALANEEFVLYYQPKLDARNGRITSAEALIRWLPRTGGIVPPGDFLPLVDEIGMTTELGDWVIRAACEQLAKWDEAGICLDTISVNVSPRQFIEGDLLGSIRQSLDSTGLAAGRLEVEILEETALEASGSASGKLEALKNSGVRIAIDDFGTGYSSLSYLVNIPAHTLKLDRAFLSPLTASDRQAAVIQGIVTLAKNLGMHVVAEGVEDREQWSMLQEMGCDYLQGYLCSPPLPPAAFASLLDRHSNTL